MNKKKTLIFILIVIVGLLLAYKPRNKQYVEHRINTDVTCPEEYLYLNELPSYITENPYAIALIKKECYLVTNSFLKDIDADNEEELFIQTSKLSCGTASCKTRDIYIVDNQETVFHKQGYDVNFRNVSEKNTFEVVEQIKYWDEPTCCSSKNLVVKYKYDGNNPILFKNIDTYIELGALNTNEQN